MDVKAMESAIENYQKVRTACYKAARENNGELMGNDAWLRFAMSEWEIELSFGGGDSINCWGSTFTNQTQSNESFDFNIPLERLVIS